MKLMELFKRFKVGNNTKEEKANTQPAIAPIWKFSFSEDGKHVKAEGIAELEQYSEGYSVGDGIACFRGKGRDETMFLANTKTGKVRKILSSGGDVLVGHNEIDYDNVNAHLTDIVCVSCKHAMYGFGFKSWFEKGYAQLYWTTHPDGMYEMDEYGFGMGHDHEENVYCIINTDLEIVVPFMVMATINGLLEKLRNRENT